MNEVPGHQDFATSQRPASLLARFSPKSPREAIQPTVAPPPPRIKVKRRRSGFVSAISNFITVAIIAAVIATGATWYVRQQTTADGPLAESKVVVVRGGLVDIAEQLEREGVISSRYMFMFSAFTSGKSTSIKAGEYQIEKQASVSDVVDVLVRGKQVLHSITFPEGLTTEQIIARLRENPLLRGEVRELPAEGSLFPDTYKFSRDTTRISIVREMQAAQKRIIEDIWKRRASDLPIKTIQEFVTLASIVEKETGKADERTRVAGVFVNRLNRKMKLQSDPTIVYGLVQGKGTLGRPILKSEIESRTAYNTYVIEGLPPGPIANPGRASLEAVANPSRTKDLFFVADGTGGHAFAETLDQHNRNVQRWRQIERTRSEQTGPKPVDRVLPPEETAPAAPAPVNPATRRRSDATRSIRPAHVSPDLPTGSTPPANEPQLPGRNAGRILVEAIEGKPKDPLRNRSFDLTNPQTVPKLR